MMLDDKKYYFSTMAELKNDYYHFAIMLKKYISSLDDNNYWRLEDCWSTNFDGSAFSIIFRSMRNSKYILSVNAEAKNGEYIFTSFTKSD